MYYLAKIMFPIFLVNAYAQFNINWIRYYEGPGLAEDKGNVVKTDSAGNIYVAGFIRTGNYIGSENYCVIKYEPNGSLAWEKSYNGPGQYIDFATDLEIDKSGNVYVTGESFGNNGNYDFCTIKYDRDGNLKWINRYDFSSGNDEAMKILRTDSDFLYVSGISENAQGNFDICLIKYSASGIEQWVKRFDGLNTDIFSDIAEDDYGFIYVAGYIFINTNKCDICLLKYSPEGDLIYSRKYDRGFQENDIAHSMVFNQSGDLYVAGRSKNSNGDYDCALLKFGQNGNLLWDRFYNGTGNDYDQASSVCIDNQNNVIITGWSWGGYSSDDFITIKYNAAGELLWAKRYDNSEKGIISSDGAEKIICDKNRNLYVLGVSDHDYLLICYNPSGEIICQYRFNGETQGEDEPKDMCLGIYNSIIITGLSEHYKGNSDICTIMINNIFKEYQIEHNSIPGSFSLSQNYPNPFNPSTKVKFHIPYSSFVRVIVYDNLGKETKTLVNEQLNTGTYEANWDASNYSSGIYYYELRAGQYRETKKMILIK